MLFGLKSVGAMYQRGIQRCLHSQLGHNVKAYIDDVVIKTRQDEGLICDLAETFDNLRKFNTKLNPEKCTFTKMKPPESLHYVQKLPWCMATLSRFISRLGVRGLPFFKLLKSKTSYSG
jgi:hypothetical protein